MSLYPPERKKMDSKDYEKVPVDDFVTATIEEVQHDKEHEFKGQYAKIDEAVRFKFNIEGLNYPHYSRWLTFSYGEETNLYSKYILSLVEDAKPDMKLDIKLLEGMKIKMLWKNDPRNSDFQVIEVVRPLTVKCKPLIMEEKNINDETVPF